MTHLNEKGEKDERGDEKEDDTQMKKVTCDLFEGLKL